MKIENENSNTAQSLLDKTNKWMRQSISLKMLIIGILILILLIPASMIQGIIEDRKELSEQTTKEVGNLWSDSQLLEGPILTIPVEVTSLNKDQETVKTRSQVHILPTDYSINGEIEPKKLNRGIYEVVVYNSNLHLSGQFLTNPMIDVEGTPEVLWDEAFLTVGISDLRGIKDQVRIKWGGNTYDVIPGSRIPTLISSGFTVDLQDLKPGMKIPFDFTLNLQGSNQLSIVPVGAQTDVKLSSLWPSPGFTGKFIPDDRKVTDDGFKAHWKILQLNRNFPQSWTGDRYAGTLKDYQFGTSLVIPLDQYQKAMRSSKYAIMTIALTFLVCFLVEVMVGQRIHPLQYILVGLSLCLFYILLVSISEHINFNIAYAISTMAVTLMISLYTLSIFKKKKFTVLMTGVLLGIYGFLYITLQLEDYALLMGTIGLTLILSTVMYFTRNINWYDVKKSRKTGIA